MPKSVYKWKRTENETLNEHTKFQRTGSPVERQLPRSSWPLRPAKVLVAWKILSSVDLRARSVGLATKAPRWSVRYPAHADIQLCKKCWEHEFPARAALPPLERTSSQQKSTGSTHYSLERQVPRSSKPQNSGKPRIVFLSSKSVFQLHYLHAMAQISIWSY